MEFLTADKIKKDPLWINTCSNILEKAKKTLTTKQLDTFKLNLNTNKCIQNALIELETDKASILRKTKMKGGATKKTRKRKRKKKKNTKKYKQKGGWTEEESKVLVYMFMTSLILYTVSLFTHPDEEEKVPTRDYFQPR